MSPKKAIAKTATKSKSTSKPVKKTPSPKKPTTGKKPVKPVKSHKPAKPAKVGKPSRATTVKKSITTKKTGIGQKTKPAATKTPSQPAQKTRKPATKRPVTSKTPKATKAAAKEAPAKKTKAVPAQATETATATKPAKPVKAATAKPAKLKTTVDEMPLDIDEKEELLEQEKKDLIKVLREDDEEPLETAFIPTDTSERYILVVDEEGQRRTETMTIISQILPNAVIEVADDPEEALDVMQEGDFDTYVVNFLMPGYSASQFVKAVANHPDHPLLIGFAADKISDALDQRKGLKIIPLKRLFDLEPSTDGSKEKV